MEGGITLSEEYKQTADNIAGEILLKMQEKTAKKLLNECNVKDRDLRELFGKIEKSLDKLA